MLGCEFFCFGHFIIFCIFLKRWGISVRNFKIHLKNFITKILAGLKFWDFCKKFLVSLGFVTFWQHRCFSWSGNPCSRKDLIDKPEQSPFLFCAHSIFIEGWKKAMFSMDKRCCQMWPKSQHPIWILMVTGGTLLHVMNHSFYYFDAALRSGCAQNLFGNITLSKCLCIHLHVVYLNSGL